MHNMKTEFLVKRYDVWATLKDTRMRKMLRPVWKYEVNNFGKIKSINFCDRSPLKVNGVQNVKNYLYYLLQHIINIFLAIKNILIMVSWKQRLSNPMLRLQLQKNLVVPCW